MNKKYVVRLTSQEWSDLERLVSVGKAAARKLLHARVLLQADVGPRGPGWSDRRISEALSAHPNTVAEVRRRRGEPSDTMWSMSDAAWPTPSCSPSRWGAGVAWA